MKIGIDARMYGPKSTTGIGTYIKELTNNLFQLDSTNEYFIFLQGEEFDDFSEPSPRVKKIKIDIPWYSWAEQVKLPKIINHYNLDLAHFPHFNVPITYNKKFIVTIHDITPKLFPGPNVQKSLIRKMGYNLTFQHSLKKSQKVISVSGHTKENILANFKVDKEKIKVIHLGYNDKFRIIENQSNINNLKEKLNITKPFILYVGVWRDHKNIEGLVKAFEILKSKKLDYQLVIAGTPDDKYPSILKSINNSSVKNDIITPGYMNDENLVLLYNAAKLFVLPSFAEGFGLVALESLNCGTPVAGSNSTSLPEILEDSAIYFNPYDPVDISNTIAKILLDDELYNHLKIRGLEQVKKYSWADCAKQTLEVYQKI